MSRDPEEVRDDGTDRSIRERPGSDKCVGEPAGRGSALKPQARSHSAALQNMRGAPTGAPRVPGNAYL
jgi:hypothetical protein